MSKSKIVFFLSGSIAAFKACQVISRLVQEGHEVQAVATSSALKFIGAATLEGLTNNAVLTDLWQDGRAMDHIHLSRWADFGILCPASANTLARLAHGMADDLVSAMILAWPKTKRLHVFPAMNHEMLSHARTQENLAKVAGAGLIVHGTQSGSLACGEEGAGRMLEAESILAAVQPKTQGSVLITAGATREPVDGIRFLSNVSTGRTGAELAGLFQNQGWQVTYLYGQGAALPAEPCPRAGFSSFTDLDSLLRTHLGEHRYDAVIHCAAVSDYSVDSVNNGRPDPDTKMSSEEEMVITFKRNYKILGRLKEYSSNKNIKVIGFKLTLNAGNEQSIAKAKDLLSPAVDAVVANDWSAVQKDRTRHPGHLVAPDGNEAFSTLRELTEKLNLLITLPGANHGSMP